MDENNLRKIAQNAVFQDTLQRVREVGLHKVAAQMSGLPEVNIKTAVAHLGKSLMLHQAKFRKINSGLDALQFLED